MLKILKQDFPSAGFERKALDKVGPVIGKEIQMTAILASLASLLGILFYVALRYEFSFAAGAVLAVIHDVLMTIGCYCLTGMFGEGRQFNATMVAAVLTIIGFSINDTIVIFDRIREDLKLGVRGSFREVINQALNQTLSRTIITSGTVFLATMSLFLFGGGAINDFAFTFLVGIITGTYSSIYIASALVCPLVASRGAAQDQHAGKPAASSGAFPGLNGSPCWPWLKSPPGIGRVSFWPCCSCWRWTLGVFHRRPGIVKFKEAIAWANTFWVILSLSFAAIFDSLVGPRHGGAISDRLHHRAFAFDGQCFFVISAHLPLYCRVPEEYQHRLLFWGILGALVMRGLMIGLGVALINRFAWLLYVLERVSDP